MIGWIKENTNLIAAGGFAWIAAAEFGGYRYPWEYEGAGVAVSAAVVVAVAGYAAAGKINDLLPEDEGIYLVAFDASDDTGGAIYEITEDQFADMDVHAGSLFEWPVGKRVYEVREYRPEENVAVANWRESVAGSELAGETMVVDAMEAIDELRQEFEPEAQKSRYLQRRLRSIARRMDRERLKDQQDILDPTVSPTFDDDRLTVSEIVAEEIPDELTPDAMTNGEHVEDGRGEDDTIHMEILDDEDPLET